MAKVIGTAAIRLRTDARGLAAEITGTLTAALREATRSISAEPTRAVRDDADNTSKHVRRVLGQLQSVVGGAARGFASMVTSGLRLALIGTAAGVALAGVSALFTGMVGLVGVLGQAAGVAGLLPAALAAGAAISATLKIGLSGVSDAMGALGEDTATFNASIEKLAPNAQAFMRALREVAPAFNDMKLGVQQRLFEGLSGSVQGLADTYLPLASRMFESIAGSLNGAAQEAVAFAQSGDTVGRVDSLFGNLQSTVASLAPAFKPALSALLDITNTGSSFLPAMAEQITAVSTRFGEFIRQAADSGKLQDFFKQAIETVKQLFSALADFGAGFAGIFQAAQTAGGGFLVNLQNIATAFREFTTSAKGQDALVGFFSSMREIITAIMPVFAEVASVIGATLAPILANLASTIGPALLPIVQGIGAAFQAAAPGIAALAAGVATFLQAAAPLLPILGQIAGIVGGALGAVFEALAPVLQEVASVLENSLAAVLPVIQPVLEQIAVAVAQLVRAAVPLIPIFLQLVAALLPLVPPLIQLVAALLPPLISLITALMPIIQAVAGVLAALLPPIIAVATTILNILIPPLNLIISVVAQIVAFIGAAFSAILSVITVVINAVAGVISTVWAGIFNTITGIVNGIGNAIRSAWQGIFNAISSAMSSIGNAVSSGISAVARFFGELPGKILNAIASLATSLFNAGVNMIRGLIDGLASMAGAVIDWFKGLIGDAVDSVLGFLGIGSPSKVFRQIGVWSGEGLVLGLKDMVPKATAAAEGMAAAVVNGAGGIDLTPDMQLGNPGGPVAAAGAAAGLAAGVILQQTNIMQPGADVQQFASEVYRNGARSLASAGSTLGVSPGSTQRGMAGDGSVFGVSGA
jgi:phage-related protein